MSSTSFIPGFGRALNSQTSADCSVCTVNERPKSLSLPSQVIGAADSELYTTRILFSGEADSSEKKQSMLCIIILFHTMLATFSSCWLHCSRQ